MKKTAADIAGMERGELGGGGRFGEFEANAGVEPVELAQDFGQDGRHRQTGERDAQMTHLAASECSQIGWNGGESAEQGFDAIEEQTSGRGDFDAASGSVQQIGIKRRFKLRNGAAQRRLSDCETLGGLAKVQLPGDLPEVN